MKKLLLLLTALVITVTSVVAESFHYDPHSNMRISANETSPTAVSVEQDSTGVTVSDHRSIPWVRCFLMSPKT